MDGPAQAVAYAAPRKGDLARRRNAVLNLALLIDEHEARIERQKLLVADLRKDGHEVMAKEAERLLNEMIVLLFKMYDDLRDAYERFDSLSG